MGGRLTSLAHAGWSRVVARTPEASTERRAARCACGMAMEGRWGQAYNEEAFRYFLAIERKRAERAGHPVLLLLVDLKEEPGAVRTRIDTRLAGKLFSCLRLYLRDTDIIGWYREGLVAGAVLTESRARPRTNVSRVVRQRVGEGLGLRLSADVVRRLRVRVYENPQPAEIPSDVGGIECSSSV